MAVFIGYLFIFNSIPLFYILKYNKECPDSSVLHLFFAVYFHFVLALILTHSGGAESVFSFYHIRLSLIPDM